MPKSTYLAHKLLDLPVGGSAYTAPTNLHFALFTTAPTVAGGGVEVSGGAYARVQVTNNGLVLAERSDMMSPPPPGL